MREIKYLVILLLASLSGYSQTIINAERLIGGKDSTIYAISLSYSGTRGNSNTDKVDISPAIVFVRPMNEYYVFGGYNVLAKSGQGILNSGFVHLRHNHKLTERIKTFAFYQLQYNDVLLLNKREVFGAGFRFEVIKKESVASAVNIGIMREAEFLDKTRLMPGEAADSRIIRATCVHSISLITNKTVKFDNVFYYQPYLGDFNDYRLLNDFSMTISISEHFKTTTTITTRFDSKPPESLKKTDLAVSYGFNLLF